VDRARRACWSAAPTPTWRSTPAIRWADADKEIPRGLGRQLGLNRLDSHWLTDDDAISPISVRGAEVRGERREFIPYTDKPIRWHTDGYYNLPDRTVRGMILHCVQSAASGGDNQLLDHEIAYILLRDENPDHIRALSRDDAMIIPARMDDTAWPVRPSPGRYFRLMPRASCTCAIRRVRSASSGVAMRPPKAAVAALARILATPTPWTLHGTAGAGHGPGLQQRAARPIGFTETAERRRLLYRARYHERVAETTVTAVA
jgi:hypothetical protein